MADPTTFGLSGATATRTERMAWLKSEYGPAPEPLRSSALDALNTLELLRLINFTGYTPANGAVYPNTTFGRAMRSAAALVKADVGIEAAQIDVGGWDTHSAQDPVNAGGSMYNTMQGLANALGAFHADVIAGTQTTNVTVVMISEFGRNRARELGPRHRPRARKRDVRDGSEHHRRTRSTRSTGRASRARTCRMARTSRSRGPPGHPGRDREETGWGIRTFGLVFPDFVPTFRGVTK
jgi:hypothetical protein